MKKITNLLFILFLFGCNRNENASISEDKSIYLESKSVISNSIEINKTDIKTFIINNYTSKIDDMYYCYSCNSNNKEYSFYYFCDGKCDFRLKDNNYNISFIAEDDEHYAIFTIYDDINIEIEYSFDVSSNFDSNYNITSIYDEHGTEDNYLDYYSISVSMLDDLLNKAKNVFDNSLNELGLINY